MASVNPINILLLGETGVGKSTFINALANYLTYNSLSEARNHELLYFVPSKFILADNNLEEKIISIGSSPNEVETPGASATQNPVSYLFNLGNITLRMIDTPGIGDTRGMKYDEINADKMLYFVSQLKYLNAICIMLKPNNSRLNVLFEYCIKQILARLDKNVQNNMVFLFTNGRSTFYTPGDTAGPLKKILKDIESNPLNVKIPFKAENTFCVDNESFRYLMASSQGITFAEDEVENYKESWQKSSTTCRRMIKYILGLQPLPMQGTVTINEARRLVAVLAQPVGEMLVLYEKSLSRLEQHKSILQMSTRSIEDLKDNLYIPITEYRVAQKIHTTTHTKSRGFNAGIGLSPFPPFITFNIGYQQQEGSQTHVEEIIIPYETRVEDKNVKSQILSKQTAVQAATQKIEEIGKMIGEIGQEADTILQAAVNFTVFLKENAIVAYDDVFQNYFAHLLKMERAKGSAMDAKLVMNLEDLLKRYQVKKSITSNVSAKDIIEIIASLLALKHCGPQFKHFYDKLYVFEDEQVYAVENDSKTE